MSIEVTAANLTLNKHGIAVLKRSRGVCLAVMRGTAWLTIDGERRDVVLQAGDRFVIESDADVAVSALAGPAAIAVRPAEPAPALPRLAPLVRTWARVRRLAAPVAAGAA